MRKLTLEQFGEEFRPKGFGEMVIEDMNSGKTIKKIKVYEVICDFCNKQIAEDESVNMAFKDSYALCDDCAKKVDDEGEDE